MDVFNEERYLKCIKNISLNNRQRLGLRPPRLCSPYTELQREKALLTYGLSSSRLEDQNTKINPAS